MTTNQLIDAIGIQHKVYPKGARIVSVVPSITELLFDLGLEANVVGRTGFCFHPRDKIREVPKIGGTKDFNLEALRNLRPTHLIVNVDENPQNLVEAAKEFVPNVLVTHPMRPEDNVELYRFIGTIFNRRAWAKDLEERFLRELDVAKRSCAEFQIEKILYVIWKKPWMTISPDTYIARVLQAVGFDHIDIGSESRYPEFKLTEWANRVDRILLSSEPYAFRPRDIIEVKDAVSDKTNVAVSIIDGEMTSWYGSRAIEGFKYLNCYRHELAGK